MKFSLLGCLMRSIYFNFKCLPFSQAVKLPILIDNSVKMRGVFHGGSFVIESSKISRGMITIGIADGSFEMGTSMSSFFRMSKDARVVFHGSCGICKGMKIDVSRSGELHFGDGVSLNSGAMVSCNSVVSFGNGVRSGWNITVIDWDGHDIVDMNSKSVVNPPKPISIGDYTWLGAKSTLLKGVSLAHHCIVPYGSVINKSCETPISIFGGTPNHILGNGKVRSDMLKDLK